MVSPTELGEDQRTIETNQSQAAVRPRSGSARLEEGCFSHEELVGGRFRIKELIQSGGMGDVYRAQDLVTDQSVALKTLRAGASTPERFEREAVRLSELNHPGIPRYITHDLSSTGRPYLVMEWLNGIDLASFLRERSVGARTAVQMMVAVSEAVAAAHHQGIIHRDLNPSNIFLVAGRPDQIKVLDFGVARLQADERPLTAEGTQIGTPGYMAPEQVEGRLEVGPQADVFALGCILYEVLSGQRAFYAPTIRELLSRIITDTPIALAELHRGVPPELERLVNVMLDKDPANRPSDAGRLRQLLLNLPALDDEPPSEVQESRTGSGVQQVTSLIVLRADQAFTYDRALQAAGPHGLKVRRGSDNTIVIATQGRGTAGDHASRAARCALAVQKATRASQIAVSTGLSQQTGEALSGRAFDAALVSLLLKDSEQDSSLGPCLWLDENTAALLDSRFEVRGTEQGFLLRGMRSTYEPARTVLGRRTRCVGRKRELSMLEATMAESFEDRVASSVLIVGAPGSGKSRLASEATKNARRTISGIQILRGGGDSMTAGSPFFALGQAIQHACRMRETEPDSLRRSKLHDHLTKIVPAEDLARVCEFLGELLALQAEKGGSLQLLAARRDAVLRGDQIVRALEDWLRAECKANPVLLLLDDFHWGDLATVKFIDSALRNLAELPLVVLTMARPEVHEIFPKIWAKRGVTELRLGGLSRRAATEMIQEVMGQGVSRVVIDRVIARGQGNPFWIEELLRAEDAGLGENVPDRMVLLAQSRIEQQSQDERRLLEAASVFGRQFWLGGAKAVLRDESIGRPLEAVARDLVEGEFIVEHELSRLGGEKEYEFASGLLRDAAYSLLDEQEREEAHSRAAIWLEKNGESDPLAIAMHFTLGGEGDRARSHYLSAAEQALAGDDLDAAISCAEEGLGAGARGPDAVRLRLVHAEASKWRGDNAVAFKSAQAAFARAEESTPEWYRAAAEAAVAAGKIGKLESSIGLAKELMESPVPQDNSSDRGIALARVASQMVFMGNRVLAAALLDAIQDVDSRLEPDPRVMGFISEARALLAGASDDPWGRISHAEQAVEHFEHAGDLRNACLARLSQGFAEVEFGATHQAVQTLEEALRVAERMGLENSIPVAQAQLGRAMARLGKLERAHVLLTAAAGAFDRQRNLRLAGVSRLYWAELHAISGHREAAFESVVRAEAILQPMPAMLRIAHANMAAFTAENDERDTALHWAEKAVSDLTGDTRLPVSETLVRLGAAAGFVSGGQFAQASELVSAEQERLQRLAETMTSERAQQFLEGSPCRRCLMKLNPERIRQGEKIHYFDRLIQLASDIDLANRSDRQIAGALQETSTIAEVERVGSVSDPVLKNLLITRCYYVLSREIAAVVDQQNVNWSTFACRASKTAGISMRNEDVQKYLKQELGMVEGQVPFVSGFVSKLFSLFGLGRVVHAAALATVQEVSTNVAEGSHQVFSELAPLLARFVDLMRRSPSDSDWEKFRNTLKSGPIEEGGQELLRKAFSAWYDASRSESESLRAQLILRANCQFGLHEQTRLQPHIQAGMRAPLESIYGRKVRAVLPHLMARLPHLMRTPVSGLILKFSAPFLRELKRAWSLVVARCAMNLSVPEASMIPLGEHLVLPERTFPLDLQALSDPKTEALIERFDRQLNPTQRPSNDHWADVQGRMGIIVELFRSRQQQRDMFLPPFDSDQDAEIAMGKIPANMF